MPHTGPGRADSKLRAPWTVNGAARARSWRDTCVGSTRELMRAAVRGEQSVGPKSAAGKTVGPVQQAGRPVRLRSAPRCLVTCVLTRVKYDQKERRTKKLRRCFESSLCDRSGGASAGKVWQAANVLVEMEYE